MRVHEREGERFAFEAALDGDPEENEEFGEADVEAGVVTEDGGDADEEA